jgi:endogenous inhibitor of DNA gyrase (YacG/DUF329 family)
MPRQVPCPTCDATSIFAPSNRWRPFCSQRCAGVDFGAWASEGYKLAALPSSEDEDDSDAGAARY